MSKKRAKKTSKKVASKAAAKPATLSLDADEPQEAVAVTRTKRRERVPFGTHKAKLSFKNKDPNYHYHVVTDKGGRLSDAQEGGYEFVVDEQALGANEVGRGASLDSRVVANTGTNEDGSPERGYLMRIPIDLYEEDQKAKQHNVNTKERAITHAHEEIKEGYDAGTSIKTSDNF